MVYTIRQFFPESYHFLIYIPQLTFPFMYGFGDGDCEQQFRQTLDLMMAIRNIQFKHCESSE